MTERRARSKPTRTYSKHGLNVLKGAVKELGSRTIDRRTALGRALAAWRTDLVNDLGGPGAISTQQSALVDLAVKSKLLLDSIDTWLLQQPSLVNARRRSLLPAVRERQQLADGLARYLSTLGLERKAPKATTLEEYLASRNGNASAASGDEDDDEAESSVADDGESGAADDDGDDTGTVETDHARETDA